jgi:hypothetical protein
MFEIWRSQFVTSMADDKFATQNEKDYAHKELGFRQ